MNELNLDIIDLPTSIYDCLAAHLIHISQYYRGQYYKLFFHPLEFEFINNSNLNFEETLVVHKQWRKNIVKYYNLRTGKLVPVGKIKELDYENKIYSIDYKVSRYPLCQNIELSLNLSHMVLLFGYKNNCCHIFDGFYGVSNLQIDLGEFESGVNDIYCIDVGDFSNNSLHTLLPDYFEVYFNKEFLSDIKQHILFVENLTEIKYNDLSFWDNLSNTYRRTRYIYDFIKGALSETETEVHDFIGICLELLLDLSEQIRVKYYILLKKNIANKRITRIDYLEFLKGLYAVLENEFNIVSTIYSIIDSNQKSLVDKIKEQMEEYSNTAIAFEDTPYKNHDGITIMKFILSMEKVNNIEINVTDFTGAVTYRDFAKRIMKVILNKKQNI